MQEIVDYVGAKGGATQYPETPVSKTQTAPPKPTTQAPAATNSMDLTKLTAVLLEVVSEKTGYPAEMLELGMDMEADLGIDSIKRVEIFGALTTRFPEMIGINPNELTELRTLQEIVDYVSAHSKKKVLN